MTIKQQGGVFGRNPTFNDVTIEGTLTFDGAIDITSDLTVEDNLIVLGNVGINRTSPNGLLHIQSNAGSDAQIYVQTGDTSTKSQLIFGDSGDSDTGGIQYDHSDDSLQFHVGNIGEKIRLDSSGTLLIGGTTAYENNAVTITSTGQIYGSRSNVSMDLNRTDTTGNVVQFRKDGAIVGSISVTASATAYNTSSDQRLKDNIVDAPSASDDIDAIQVRSFDWKADRSHQKYGMIAQELVTVAPEAVSQPDDPEEMMGVDYSKLVPMLIKEVQQLRARVAQLEGDD